jgi:transposase-like protein
LKGVELVVSDDHAGLVAAIGEVIPQAAWQRCYVHFLRNALDHRPRKARIMSSRTQSMLYLLDASRRRRSPTRDFLAVVRGLCCCRNP